MNNTKSKVCDICEKNLEKKETWYFDGLYVCRRCYNRMKKHVVIEKRNRKQARGKSTGG